MLTAKEVARYIIAEAQKQSPQKNGIEPEKLQALLYYVQGYSLALTGKPAFPDKIEAWECGLVVESVYREYEEYNGGLIPYSVIEQPAL